MSASTAAWKGQTRPWPAWAGMGLLVAGIALLAASMLLTQKVRASAAITDQLQIRTKGELLQPSRAPGRAVAGGPYQPLHLHLDDVGELARIAQRHNMQLGPITYRMENHATLPLAIRLVDLQVEAEYPHLKAFIADLLRSTPHAYLDEIRIEHASSAGTTRIKAALKLAFVYDKPPGGSVRTGLIGGAP